MSFTITVTLVATMLAYAVPAFLLLKSKLIKESAIHGIASILLYICTPSIIIHSFLEATADSGTVTDMLIFAAFAIAVMAAMIGALYLILKRKFDDPRARVATIASSLGNCGFFGIPILQALLPDQPHVMIFSAVMSVFMNFISFTFGLMIMSGDAKYVTPKKLFLNPSVLSLLVALPLFAFNVQLPDAVSSALDLFVKMSTPLCMFVLGMRLATVRFSEVFTNPYAYLAVFAKQIVMPLIAVLITVLVPCDPTLEMALVIMCACPVATVVLNLSEVIESGQRHALNTVLLGTILSIVTLPLIMLLC